MAFRVEVAPQAFEDLERLAGYITTSGSFEAAEKWFNGMLRAIASLKEMPGRCPLAEESRHLGQEVRVLLHGHRQRAYRVYFSVQQEAPGQGIVRVFHVRHWARRAVGAEEFQQWVD